ncbi:putative hexose transporter 12 [Sitophilus oryzae]|uniref:Hexose transporter 12 n=1 Tax=Sitophilus oryzae TaxID=7048 RepID=A0A6J2XYL1_SITOR|nr:putative hexose transporter 12 [Sitophilus oryzae]
MDNNVNNNNAEIRAFETYSDTTGWGFYNRFTIGMLCMSALVNSLSYVALPMALAVSNCNMLTVPISMVLKIFTSFFLGRSIGGLITSSICDRYGRKKYMIYGLICMFMSLFTMSFAYSGYVINTAVIFLGVGVESTSITAKLLVAEMLPKNRRGLYIVLYDFFWILGYIITTSLVILLETSVLIAMTKDPDSLATWRIILAICGGFNLVIACACALLEESPRYILHSGRTYLAYLILKQVYAINNSCYADYYKVREESLRNLVKGYDLTYSEPADTLEMLKRLCCRTWNAVKMLFSKKYRCITLILICIKTPIIIMGFFHLNAVCSKILTANSLGVSPKTLTGTNFLYPIYHEMSLNESNITEPNMCAVNEESELYYRYFLLLTGAMLPGVVFSLVLIEILGRKPILSVCSLVSNICFLILCYLNLEELNLVWYSVILGCSVAIFSTISVVNIESYPTAIRATAQGVTSFFGHFLCMFVFNFIMVEPSILFLIMGVASFGSFIGTFFLPELKSTPMAE